MEAGTAQTYLSDVLHVVSQSLLAPDIILLLVFIGYSLFSIGSAIAEEFSERRYFKVVMPKFLAALMAAKEEDIPQVIEASGLLKRQKAALNTVYEYRDLPGDALIALVKRLVNEEESRYDRISGRDATAAKVAPMLGLMGTLIPLGPGIQALGQADTAALSASLLVAFDTTVAGLVTAAICLVVGKIRNNWYNDYLSALDAGMATLLEKIEDIRDPNRIMENADERMAELIFATTGVDPHAADADASSVDEAAVSGEPAPAAETKAFESELAPVAEPAPAAEADETATAAVAASGASLAALAASVPEVGAQAYASEEDAAAELQPAAEPEAVDEAAVVAPLEQAAPIESFAEQAPDSASSSPFGVGGLDEIVFDRERPVEAETVSASDSAASYGLTSLIAEKAREAVEKAEGAVDEAPEQTPVWGVDSASEVAEQLETADEAVAGAEAAFAADVESAVESAALDQQVSGAAVTAQLASDFAATSRLDAEPIPSATAGESDDIEVVSHVSYFESVLKPAAETAEKAEGAEKPAVEKAVDKTQEFPEFKMKPERKGGLFSRFRSGGSSKNGR